MMNTATIYSNDYVNVTSCQEGFYLESFRPGFSIHDFNQLITRNPQIRITSFAVIRNALLNPPQSPTLFGVWKDRIAVDVSSDGMKATVTLSFGLVSPDNTNRSHLLQEIETKLHMCGVLYGLRTEQLIQQWMEKPDPAIPLLAAEGVPAVNGEDSMIRMYELKEPKPEIRDDGKADYYELNLVNRVRIGDWLGERKEPTAGIPGKTVRGEVILPLPGRRYPLFYDPAAVREVTQNGITTLCSLVNGAVRYEGDKITVSNHLEIAQDVDFNTGNIDFDGYLTVKGAIADNFSVAASDDIEILGEFGVGSVREVISRNGSIYIKGGIAGKSRAVIRSGKDLFTKYISDATVICDGVVHVGYYCLNSTIKARQLIIGSAKGQIIGGNIQAEQKILTSFLGSSREKRTSISVSGFDRRIIKEKLDKLQEEYQVSLVRLSKAKQVFSIFTNAADPALKKSREYEAARESYFMVKDEAKALEKELRLLLKTFKVRGEGEICFSKKAFPNTAIEMGKNYLEVKKELLPTCFYLNKGVMKEV